MPSSRPLLTLSAILIVCLASSGAPSHDVLVESLVSREASTRSRMRPTTITVLSRSMSVRRSPPADPNAPFLMRLAVIGVLSSLFVGVFLVLALTFVVLCLHAVLAHIADRLIDARIVKTAWQYVQCLVYYWVFKGSYAECPYFPASTRARVQVYSLALIPMLWSKPHYRSASLQQDLLDNLKNVALPGTGLPLSYLCVSKLVAYPFILFGIPLVCLFAALRDRTSDQSTSTLFERYLLHPTDWFSLWQLNCRLASVHSTATQAPGYAMESKWEFLVQGEALGVPVSPYIKTPKLVMKNKNVEGGMGIHFFKNASVGGDWIMQPVFENAPVIAKLLTSDAPLSTVRVITISNGALHPEAPTTNPEGLPIKADDLVEPLCAVFRAGRAGASTDHSSILYDVNHATSKIRSGAVNAHWYKLGLGNFNLFNTTADQNSHTSSTFDAHPDSGVNMIGAEVASVPEMFEICRNAHFKLLPDVPIAGWDVAITTEGMYLLEANLSCNFFLGSFDLERYIAFVDRCFAFSDARLS